MRATYSIVVKRPGRSSFVRWLEAESEADARHRIAELYGESAIESICALPPPVVRK